MRLDPEQMRARDFPLVYKQFHTVSVVFLTWLKTRPTLTSSQLIVQTQQGGVFYTIKSILNYSTPRESTAFIQVTSSIDGDEPELFLVTANCDFRSYGVTYGLAFVPIRPVTNDETSFSAVPGNGPMEFFVDRTLFESLIPSDQN